MSLDIAGNCEEKKKNIYRQTLDTSTQKWHNLILLTSSWPKSQGRGWPHGVGSCNTDPENDSNVI